MRTLGFNLMPHSFSRNVLIKAAESLTRESRLYKPRLSSGKRLRSNGLSLLSREFHLDLSLAKGSFNLGRILGRIGGGERPEPSKEKPLVEQLSCLYCELFLDWGGGEFVFSSERCLFRDESGFFGQ